MSHDTQRLLTRTCAMLALASSLVTTAWAASAAPPVATAASAVEAEPQGVPPLVTLKDKTSYATGVMTARNLVKNHVEFDVDLLIQGLRDAMAGGAIRMNEKELKKVLQSMQVDMQRTMNSERQVKASVNRERGVVFQNEFRAKPDTIVLPGNLMYRVIKNGNGDKPGEMSTVVMRYRGTFVDGTEFESTPEGKTVTLKVTDVITGWREALKRMNAGSTWEVVVPPSMAYGTRGSGAIGPNETLVFTVELVAVVQ
jgi:FKBP-type peptidyl-prolyl cis-trans isomerase FklB